MSEQTEKFPELAAARKRLEAEKAALLQKTAELRAKRDALNAEIEPKKAELRELTKQIRAAEQPRLGVVENQLAALARAMGARGTRDAK